MGAGAGQQNVAVLRDTLEFFDGLAQVGLGFGDGAANPRHDLHGGLHELVPDMGVLAPRVQAGQRGQDRVGVLAQQPALGVDELQLPLDAERRAPRRIPADGHGRPPFRECDCDITAKLDTYRNAKEAKPPA